MCKRIDEFVATEDMSDIEQFEKKVFFASGIGDLLINLCADVLGLPIVLLTSLKDMDVYIQFPRRHQITSLPIYLCYNADGPGHYDGTNPLDLEDMQLEGGKYIPLSSVKSFVQRREGRIEVCLNSLSYETI